VITTQQKAANNKILLNGYIYLYILLTLSK